MLSPGVKHLRIVHRLRCALAVLGFVALLAAAAVLWWANRTGLPDSWRDGIEANLRHFGVHAEIGSLQLDPLRGVVAREVTVFADATHARALSRFQRLKLDIDRSRLARGEFQLERIELAGARISMLSDPADPDSPALVIDDAHGRIDMLGGRRFAVTRGRGLLGGLQLEFDGHFRSYRPRLRHDPEGADRALEFRRRLLLALRDGFADWGPSGGAPPRLRIRARGDLDDPASLRATLRLEGREFRVRKLEVDSLSVDAELHGRTLVAHHAELRLDQRALILRGAHDLEQRETTFKLSSRLDPVRLLTGLRLPGAEQLPQLEGAPEFEIEGRVEHPPEQPPRFHLSGFGRLEGPRWRQLAADHLEASFAWDGSRLFLDELLLRADGRQLRGRVFVTPERVRYRASSDLPPAFWQRAVTIQPLAGILADFTGTEDTAVQLDFEGHAHRLNPTDWSFEGHAEARHLSFRGVPVESARVDLDLDTEILDFRRGEVVFDYRNEPLRRKHGGPETSRLTVERIRYDEAESTVRVDDLRGHAWPAPVVRTFAPGVARQLEAYGFHRPPELLADGLVGIGRGLPRQDLRVEFLSEAPADYPFLGRELTLASPRGRVRVLPDRVELRALRAGLFDGTLRASLDRELEAPRLRGEIDWTGLALPRLAATYELSDALRGEVTGRLEFEHQGDDVAGLDGEGHLALERARLFEAPIFGPLSPLISAVLDNRRAGFEQANSAFFTFGIEDGRLRSDDFLTTTPSLVFTGEGSADLPARRLDMTIRMNARGLFGVITLPLRPFYGLFQFRGSGPLDRPEWERVAFTSPPEAQQRVLLDPPKARAVPGAAPPAAPANDDSSAPRGRPASPPHR